MRPIKRLKKPFAKFPEQYKAKTTSLSLNLISLSQIKALVRLTHSGSHSAVIQQALEVYIQNLHRLYPRLTQQVIDRVVQEELKVVARKRKRGRPKEII